MTDSDPEIDNEEKPSSGRSSRRNRNKSSDATGSNPEPDKKRRASPRSSKRTNSLETDSDHEIGRKKKHSPRTTRRTKSSKDYDSDPEIDKKKKHSSTRHDREDKRMPRSRDVVLDERKPTKTSEREKQDREAKRRATQRRVDSSESLNGMGQSNHDGDKRDREAKRRARSPRPNKVAVKPGALSVGVPESDRDAKRRGRRQGSNKDLKPGAVSSGGEHKSRTKARQTTRSASPGSDDSIEGISLDAREIQKLRQDARAHVAGAVASNNDNKVSAKSKRNNQRAKKSIAGKQVAKGTGESEVVIAAATSNDDDGDFAAVAEMIDEETENERIEKMMAEKEKQIREELAAANAQSNNNVNGIDADTLDKDEDESEQGSHRGRNICCGIICLLLIAGGVVGALFGTGTFSSEPAAVTPEDSIQTDAPTVTVTDSPTASVPTTDLPSSSPTFLLFGPPDVDTCQLISEGAPLEGQDQWSQKNFVVQLDAELSLLSEVEPLYSEIKESVQKITMPKLAGCDVTTQRLRRLSRGVHRGGRMLNDPLKYVVGNGVVLEITENADGCLSSTASICISIKVEITVYIQEETSNFDLITRLSEAFNSPFNLTPELGLDGTILTLIAVQIRTLDPTMEPSMAPSFIPSEPPTTGPPSDSPSSKPSFAPVTFPTTSAPTVRPSKAPSLTPSRAPTELPSSSPSKRPSIAPVVGETPVPTQTPSRTPSLVPSLSPSKVPSSTPSRLPSASPSEAPSTVPSRSPSGTPSVQPSSPAPTETTRESLVVSALNAAGLADLEADALNWLVNEDEWPTDDAYELVERYALATIYYNWNVPNWNSNNNKGWMSSDSACLWSRTACAGNYVTQFILNSGGEIGADVPIPSAIGAMTKLTRLELGFNPIASFENGSIPSTIQKLTKLKLLTLRNVGITSIGSELSVFSEMKKLVLRENNTPGAFPTSILSLTKLTYLDIASNQFTGAFPQELTNLNLVSYLALSSNSWGTSIPAFIGQMTALNQVYINDSQMTGQLPTELLDLTNLVTLTSRNNNHIGPIPPLHMGKLRTLGLENNGLTGSIPPLPSTLTSCTLQDNSFVDTTNANTLCDLV